MHAGLRKLMWLLFRGDVRRTLRSARTVRGALVILFFAAMTTFFLAIMLLTWLFAPANETAQLRTLAREYGAFLMFGGWLMTVLLSSGKLALAFRLAEVALLFPAPVSRRQIVAYKFASMIPSVFMLAIAFSAIVISASGSWLATAIGLFLALEFFHLSLVTVALVRQIVAARLYDWTRRLTMAAVALIVVFVVAKALLVGGDWREAVGAFRHTWLGASLLLPFELFCRVITTDALDLATTGYAALGTALDAALLTAVMFLDAAYIEEAAAASESLYQRLQSWRRGVWSPRVRAVARSRLRCLPRMGGVGSLAWWQLLHLWRSFSALFYASPVILLLVLTILLVYDTKDVRVVLCVLLTEVAVLNSVAAAFFPFGLRGDVDRLDVLRALPLSPAAVVVGELLPAALVLSLGQCLLLAGAAAIHAELLMAAIVGGFFTLPVNLLLLGLNTLLFLIFPYRTASGVAGLANMQAHHLLILVLDSIVIGGLALLAVGSGLVAYLVRQSWVAFVIGAWCAVCLEIALVLVPAFWAFHRFDVSLETPPE